MISTAEKKTKIQKLNTIRLISFAGALLLFLAALAALKGLFMTLLFASIISLAFRPLVDFLCRFQIPRALVTALVFVSFISAFAWGCVLVFPFFSAQFQNLNQEFPAYVDKISLLAAKWQKAFEDHVFTLNIDSGDKLKSWLGALSASFLKTFPQELLNVLTIAALAPLFAYFMVKSELGLTRGLLAFVPNPVFEMMVSLHHKIVQQIGVFVRAKLLEALCVGLIVGLGLGVIGFPFAILLAIFAGIVNIIPYVGPLIGAAPVFFVGLANNYEPSALAFVMGVYFFSQVVDYFILVPALLARIVNLHPLTVIVIIIAGAQFMGIAGMIISIPLANALKVSAVAVYQHLTENL